MTRAERHNRLTSLSVAVWMLSLLFVQTVVASKLEIGGKDSTTVRDSLRMDTTGSIRPTVSEIDLRMSKSNSLINATSPDGELIQISKSATVERNLTVRVPTHLILQTVEKNQMAIRSLYEKFLRQDHFLRGKITLAIEFDGNGVVRSTGIILNTTRNAQFAAELTHHVRRWIMPKFKMGNRLVRVVHTFVFS